MAKRSAPLVDFRKSLLFWPLIPAKPYMSYPLEKEAPNSSEQIAEATRSPSLTAGAGYGAGDSRRLQEKGVFMPPFRSP